MTTAHYINTKDYCRLMINFIHHQQW